MALVIGADREYRYSRAAARSLLFSYLAGWLPPRHRRRFRTAFRLLTEHERSILHQHRARVHDWDLEEAAVDRLRGALRTVDAEWRDLKAAA